MTAHHWSVQDAAHRPSRMRSGLARRPWLKAAILTLMGLLALICAATIGKPMAQAAANEGAAPTRYVKLEILAPLRDQTVHDNLGRLELRVATDPPVRGERGDHIRILIDDRAAATMNAAGTHTLSGIERGSHTLKAVLLDRDGHELIASEAITFHMWQASRLFPQRTDRPVPRSGK